MFGQFLVSKLILLCILVKSISKTFPLHIWFHILVLILRYEDPYLLVLKPSRMYLQVYPRQKFLERYRFLLQVRRRILLRLHLHLQQVPTIRLKMKYFCLLSSKNIASNAARVFGLFRTVGQFYNGSCKRIISHLMPRMNQIVIKNFKIDNDANFIFYFLNQVVILYVWDAINYDTIMFGSFRSF